MPEPSDRASFAANAFSEEFLRRLDCRGEPETVAEGGAAGPWVVRPHPAGGWAVLRAAERLEEGDAPAGVFERVETARLMAAVLPGAGREAAYRLREEAGEAGYFLLERHGQVVGRLRLFDAGLVTALNVLDALRHAPEALALLLEAAGRVTLEHTGMILARRLNADEG